MSVAVDVGLDTAKIIRHRMYNRRGPPNFEVAELNIANETTDRTNRIGPISIFSGQANCTENKGNKDHLKNQDRGTDPSIFESD